VAPLAAVLADPKVITTPDPDLVSPGFLGFMVVFTLAVVTVLLIRSMVTHLRRARFNAETARLAEPKRTSDTP
jgi:hypothetical protein